MELRINQAWAERSPDIPEPSVRINQAYGEVLDAPPFTLRINQAWVTAAASGVGTLRINQAWATAALPPDVVLSGLKVRRAGNLSALTARTYRNGSL